MALSEDGKSVMDSLVFRHALKEAAKNRIPMFSHCEDKALVDGGVMNAGARSRGAWAAGNYERSRRRYRCQRYSDGKRDRLPVASCVIVQQRTAFYSLKWQSNRGFL